MSDSLKLDQIAPLIIENSKQLRELNEKLTAHIASEDTAIKSILRAFPEGDIEGHQTYHALLIKKEEARARIRQAVIEKTLAGLVWFLLATMALGLVHYIRGEVIDFRITKAGG